MSVIVVNTAHSSVHFCLAKDLTSTIIITDDKDWNN